MSPNGRTDDERTDDERINGSTTEEPTETPKTEELTEACFGWFFRCWCLLGLYTITRFAPLHLSAADAHSAATVSTLLYDDDNDDCGIEIRHTLLMWSRMMMMMTMITMIVVSKYETCC